MGNAEADKAASAGVQAVVPHAFDLEEKMTALRSCNDARGGWEAALGVKMGQVRPGGPIEKS